MKQQTISKSQFKAKVLEYMRYFQQYNQTLIITDMANPVIEIKPRQALKNLTHTNY